MKAAKLVDAFEVLVLAASLAVPFFFWAASGYHHAIGAVIGLVWSCGTVSATSWWLWLRQAQFNQHLRELDAARDHYDAEVVRMRALNARLEAEAEGFVGEMEVRS
jgi:hypothetical protein